MSVRRSTFERLGGFDLNFQGNFYGEENEFLERLCRASGKIANGRDCVLIHRWAPAGGCDNRSRANRWYRYVLQNNLYWMLKRPPWEKLTSTPRHMARIVRHHLPRDSRLFRPSFWKEAVFTAIATAIRLAIIGAKPPFWPSTELLSTPPVVGNQAGLAPAKEPVKPRCSKAA